MEHFITRNISWIITILGGKVGKSKPRTQFMKTNHRKYTGKNSYKDLKVTVVNREE